MVPVVVALQDMVLTFFHSEVTRLVIQPLPVDGVEAITVIQMEVAVLVEASLLTGKMLPIPGMAVMDFKAILLVVVMSGMLVVMAEALKQLHEVGVDQVCQVAAFLEGQEVMADIGQDHLALLFKPMQESPMGQEAAVPLILPQAM